MTDEREIIDVRAETTDALRPARLTRRLVLRRAAGFGAAVPAMALLAACGSSSIDLAEAPTVTRIPVEGAPTDVPSDVDPNASPVPEEDVAEAPPAEGEAPAGGGGEPVLLEAVDIAWNQETLDVPTGGSIDLVNLGQAPHNFVVEGYNDDAPVDMPIGGEVVNWPIPADLAEGEYVYYCAVPGHRALMEGVLTIGGAAPPAGVAGGGEEAPPAASGAPVLLEAVDIAWNQETLSVPVGGSIDLVNLGASAHNFAIDGYNDDAPVDMPIGGEVVNWPIPADLAEGEYTYYCAIPGHRALMEGVLTVGGAAAPAAGGGEAPAAGGGGAPPVLLEAVDIAWNQEALTVPVGGSIDLVNLGSPHNFAIDGYNDDAPVDMPVGGEVVNWPIPADLGPGEYTYYCAIPGHRALMEGILTIQ
ncbi:MAG: plastocyanin/azurin family copper-binding protein [Thermomicrobiales bacterium]